jgi:hypothetical protein
MAQPATPAGCSVIEADVFVSQKKKDDILNSHGTHAENGFERYPLVI